MSETPRDPSIDAIHAAETPEQAARDLLESMGVEDAQSWTSGDVVGLANLLHVVRGIRREDARLVRGYASHVEALHDDPDGPGYMELGLYERFTRLEELADLLERLTPSEDGP